MRDANKNKDGFRVSGKWPAISCNPPYFQKELLEVRSKMDHTYVFKKAAKEISGENP